MSELSSTLSLAQRLRRDSQDTCLPLYANLMLRAAQELEEFALTLDAPMPAQYHCDRAA